MPTTEQEVSTSPIGKVETISFKIGEAEVSFEYGRVARSASGSVIVKCEETMILVTATGSGKPRSGIDFFPLLCDYEEKMYSIGKIPGGFIKREGRPSEKAVLTCRLMDRPIRPLWPEGYRNDVQVVAAPWSVDGINQPDVLAILGASMALELSGLPFDGPLGAVRVGLIDGQFIANPTFEESAEGTLDLVVSGTEDSIMMVEAGADFVAESVLIDALAFAHIEIKKQCAIIKQFREQCGIAPKSAFEQPLDLSPLVSFVKGQVESDVLAAYHNFDRDQRKATLEKAKDGLKEAIAGLADDHEVSVLLKGEALDHVSATFKSVEKRIMRTMILDEGVRADGRKTDEVRPIICEVGVIPRVHGSALFTRGNTQVMSIVTLGSPGDKQKLDGVDPETEKRFMHHYAFPGYSVGEVKPMRGVGRREIGHGALAGRANEAALPDRETFPYSLRVNSEILESNGSTSMAATCGTSMALMDAGVPVTTPISGIAMGLIKEGEKFAVLTDIQGLEDFLGDMDFKVTGNSDGITALQMDIKIKGISIEIMTLALEQARIGRLHILSKMAEAITEPRDRMSPYAPRILTYRIDKEQIGMIIGPGGKTIRGIIEQTEASIDIEDDGLITITSIGEGGERALEIITEMTRKIESGMMMKGKVVRIIPIGAFVELSPGKDGMVHISQIANERVNNIEDFLSVDDIVCVKVREVDDMGRINLTIKGASAEERAELGFDPLPAAAPRPEGAPQGHPAGGGGGDRPRHGGGDRNRGPRQD